MDSRYINFGQRITGAREDAGLSKIALAEKMGCSATILARLEEGTSTRISIENLWVLLQLGRQNGINPAWLLEGIGQYSSEAEAYCRIAGKATGGGTRLVAKYNRLDERGKAELQEIADGLNRCYDAECNSPEGIKKLRKAIRKESAEVLAREQQPKGDPS